MGKLYAICTVKKLKTSGNMTSRYNHDYRLVNVKNAVKDDLYKNEILIPTGKKENGKRMTYAEACKKKMREHGFDNPRKNAVRALDLILTYTDQKTDDLVTDAQSAAMHKTAHGVQDLDAWKQKNIDWLEKTFGRENIISVVCHEDEMTPHIHAVVLPVDDRGRLNASYYIGGAALLSQMQDSYADAMAIFGLSRGERNSKAVHEPPKLVRRRIEKEGKEIPKPEIGETAEEFYQRNQQHLSDIAMLERAKAEARIRRREQELTRKQNEVKEQLAHDKEAWKSEKEKQESRIAVLHDQAEEARNRSLSYEKDEKALKDEMESRFRDRELQIKSGEELKHFLKHLGEWSAEHPEEAELFLQTMREIEKYGREKEKMEKEEAR